jgi:arylsulfatase A-like enzyme
MPTLMSLAGCAPQEDPHWDGLDIRPLLMGEAMSSRVRTIYTRYEDGMNALREGDWKLVTLGSSEWARGLMPGQDRSDQLFNITADPLEADNLAGRHPEILTALQKKLAGEMAVDEREKRRIWGETGAR